LFAVLIPELINAGVQLAPLLAGLFATRAALQAANANRPDVADAEMKAVEDAIVLVQGKIDAAAAAAPAGAGG